MSTRGNGRAIPGSSTIGDDDKPLPMFQKQSSTSKRENKAPQTARTCSCRMPLGKGFSSWNYIKHIGGKIAGVLRMMSQRRTSPKVTTSSERVKPCVAPLDSQRAQAIDDCIEFINSSSSSSLSRSKSVSH